ncbi:MAG TPA: glycosyltransferase family 9 protein [Nitrospirota bacterium]|nr:glycosyltransferase family 9 protein [Nitrospirota bacterium]
MNEEQTISNILIIKPGAIGDLLELTPVIRALSTKYPGVRISLMVGTYTTSTLFQHNPHVNEVIVFDKRGEHKTLSSLLKLWKGLRKKKFDLIIHFQRSNLKTWILASAALPCRILIYHKSRKRDVHVLDNYLETIAPLGIHDQNRTLELYTGKEDDKFADDLFSREGYSSGIIIAFNPGASNPIKQWSAEHFSTLADNLAEKISAKIIIIGGKEDAALAASIAGAAKKAKPLVLAGQTTLLELGAILRKCDLLVSGDTGPLHLATAVGTRVLGLFGSVDPARTGPVGIGHRVIQAKNVPCVPCRSNTCTNAVYLDCMKSISIDDVAETVLDMLREVHDVTV